jgi:hypothetical protein
MTLVIQWFHRFAMVLPSRHPREGRPGYFWVNPAHEVSLDEFPDREGLAVLPPRWVEGLRATRIGTARAKVALSDGRAWVLERPGGDCPPCAVLRATYNLWSAELEAARSGGAYPTMNDGVHAMMGDSAKGHVGLYWCLSRFAKRYLSVVKDRRSPATAQREFHCSVTGEAAALQAQWSEKDDACSWDFASWGSA